MGGKLLERRLAREDDARRGWAFLRHLPQIALVGALADYDEFGLRAGGEDPGPDANERVLPFALDQSRNAHDRRIVADPVTFAQTFPPRRRKREVLRRNPARQAHDSGVPDEGAEPTEGCLRQVGDDVGVVKDLSQSQAPGRDPRPKCYCFKAVMVSLIYENIIKVLCDIVWIMPKCPTPPRTENE